MSIIEGLNKNFESNVRLGIMSILVVNESVDFKTLKEMLNVSDGNLASHIKSLEKVNYIIVEKKFIGKKTNTSYIATLQGKQAFKNHIEAIENFLKSNNKKFFLLINFVIQSKNK